MSDSNAETNAETNAEASADPNVETKAEPNVETNADPKTESSAEPKNPAADPLRSVHTNSFPQLLNQIASSVLVTTYQAGKLVVLREDGGVLNTHFRNLNKPMGLTEFGPLSERSGDFDCDQLLQAVERYPKIRFAMFWHSWQDNDVAIVDHDNGSDLIANPKVITRDRLPSLRPVKNAAGSAVP